MPVYFSGIILLGLVWSLVYLRYKKVRKQIIIMSSISTVLGLSQILYFVDYWRPDYIFDIKFFGSVTGIEDFLCSFFLGGIASTIYEIIFRRRVITGKPRIYLIVTLLLLSLSIFIFLTLSGMQSIWASIFAMIILAFYIYFSNRQMAKDMLWSGTFMTIFVLIVYGVLLFIFPNFYEYLWITDAFTSQKEFLFVPLEELLWFLVFGLAFGALYEFSIIPRNTSKV